jgi:hypothetical protein
LKMGSRNEQSCDKTASEVQSNNSMVEEESSTISLDMEGLGPEIPRLDEKGSRKKWGPIYPERKSTRIQDDGRTMMEKAQDNKRRDDVEGDYGKGNTKKS